MKFDKSEVELDLDLIDFGILEQLQQNCKRPLAAIGEKVGLTAPSVLERIHKLEEAGVIRDYVAVLDGRQLGKDVTAFIGVSVTSPRALAAFEQVVERIDEVLECHHVTGAWTLMKVNRRHRRPRARDRAGPRDRGSDAHRDHGRALDLHRAHPDSPPGARGSAAPSRPQRAAGSPRGFPGAGAPT
jgi:DNA-binding Lrp family transcriptional regulator